jgi:hypothetical protein
MVGRIIEDGSASTASDRRWHTGIARDTRIGGFKDPTYEIPRGFIEDWVANEEKKVAEERRSTLHWAIVAGVTGFFAVVATVIGLFIQLAH